MQPGILFITHSSRPVDVERCSLNFLTQRYADPQRLDRLPELDQLPAVQASDYSSGLSLHRVLQVDGVYRLERFAHLRTVERIQQVSALDEQTLLVCLESALEVWTFEQPVLELVGDLELARFSVRRIESSLFAGLHNLVPLDGSRVAVSASSADAVLLVDIESDQLEQMLRMPDELYGHNYVLNPDSDLQRNYIGNEQQTTHINHVSRMGSHHLLVSALIPGALGMFDLRDGSYREITRGFIGCHGARISSRGEIYFADSCNGNIVWLDQQGHILRRADLSSRWLHDVQETLPDLYACSVADANVCSIFDLGEGKVVQSVEFPKPQTGLWARLAGSSREALGSSTKFISHFIPTAGGD